MDRPIIAGPGRRRWVSGRGQRDPLHAVINGHVLFFADCLSVLAETPREKVFTLLETGSRAALNALLSRCGLRPAVANMIVRLVMHARAADLECAARA